MPACYSKIHPRHDSSSSEYVHPSRWCITHKDLVVFKKMVHEAWKAGRIPDTPHPSDLHPCDLKNPHHDDPEKGPTVFRLNNWFIKPETAKKGGMSWALMVHPEGLKCDVFATHCWQECIFDFVIRVRRAWPQGGRHLYVCFLANPQNSDIGAMLQCELSASPFASALNSARFMIVIPNANASIYTRIWCVYEAYLAVAAVGERDLAITLPDETSPTSVVLLALPGLVLMIPGFWLGYVYFGHADTNPAMLVVTTFFCACLISSILRGASSLCCGPRKAMPWMIVTSYMSLGIQGFTGGIAFWSLHASVHCSFLRGCTPLSHGALQHQQHVAPNGTEGAISLLIIAVLAFLIHEMYLLIWRSFKQREESELFFECVSKAESSSKHDRDRILDCIGGEMDSVNEAILRLKSVGRYDSAVKFNLDRGLAPASVIEGVNPCKVAVGCTAWLFWMLADLSGVYGLVGLAIFIHLCVVFLAIALTYWIGEVVIFFVNINHYCSMAFVMVSCHPFFFESRGTDNSFMEFRTQVLLAAFVGLMLLINALFYSKAFLWMSRVCCCSEVVRKIRTRAIEPRQVPIDERAPLLANMRHVARFERLDRLRRSSTQLHLVSGRTILCDKGHPLEEAHLPSARVCDICGVASDVVKCCPRCTYDVCRTCEQSCAFDVSGYSPRASMEQDGA